MKKVLIGLTVIMSVLLIAYGSSYAISGQCANCHTMHAMQNGTWVGDPDINKHGYLLLTDCIGCHSEVGTPKNNNGDNSYGAPIVLHTTARTGQGGTQTLAGGDFYWVKIGSSNDAKGHNVSGISGQDSSIGPNLTYTPPGWDPTATSGGAFGAVAAGAANWGTTQLTCAGTYGCHGKHTETDPMLGIHGAHHNNKDGTHTAANSTTTATGGATTPEIEHAVGGSYRFLGGIYGLENTDWNYNETTSYHNEYYGINGNASYSDRTTISYSCAECHGIFHSVIGSASPWLRHPTDVDLPDSGEYSAYKSYNLVAPIARTGPPTTVSDSVTAGTGIVMCLSCHRAHGSDQPDLLRWDYSTMIAGGGVKTPAGCFACHTQKYQTP